MSYNKREMQKSFYDISQKNANMFNHVFDEMNKMRAEIKLLKSKVEFQDSVLSSLVRPSISGIYEKPYAAYAEDIHNVPERKKLTVDDLICDTPTVNEPESVEPSLTMDEFFRKSQIKGIRPVPLVRQTNRLSDTINTEYLDSVPLTRQSCYIPLANGLPPLVSRESSPLPFPSFVSTDPQSEYNTTPFNYTSYHFDSNYV